MSRLLTIALLLLLPYISLAQNALTVVELNVENLFDTQHDSLKNDYEFLPDGANQWTKYRYWEKLNKIGQELIACGQDSASWNLPDIIGLCEVENDTVLRDLTKRSLLRKARYEYFVTDSPNERGIDVALLYSPFSFAPINHDTLRVVPTKDMRPTRDILYVSGRIISGDTLHIFVIHAPSRRGGESASRPHRIAVMKRLCLALDSIGKTTAAPNILIMGDFNDYANSPSLQLLYNQGLVNVSSEARGVHGAKGTYRYHGKWGSLDQIIVSHALVSKVKDCHIEDDDFLLEDDEKYGGKKPKRFFYGPRYNGGFSDHLPLVLRLIF